MENAQDFVDNYKNILKIDTFSLNAEAVVMKNMLQLKGHEINIDNIMQHIKKEYYPNLYKLLQISRILPVSSSSCERSFSAMRRIKTWLRATMIQDRFSNLSVIHIENEIVKNKITAEKVLCKFPRSMFL
uniref:Uncharacterized protein LOC114327671 n=1 Tax=Diabrotica virgifera virgifera TaxID=50390 RepID=A0A6P7FG11_DIAVI